MTQIGCPQRYAEPVEPETHPAVAPVVLSEQRMSPKTPEDFTDDHYHRLKQAFLAHCETSDGPWQLTANCLKTICARTGLPTGKHVNISAIWLRMVRELCPEELIVPPDFDVLERIREVDDNRDIIFAVGAGPFLGSRVRVLMLSNVATAILLRMAFK